MYEKETQTHLFFFAPVSKHFIEENIVVSSTSVLPSFGNCLSLHFDMHGYPKHTLEIAQVHS